MNMRVLIEVALPYVINVGVCENGSIKLVDGKTDLEISYQVYHANYLKEFSTITQSANLEHGGVLADYEDFSFTIVDDNLLSAVELSGNSLNSGKVKVIVREDTSSYTVWYGYVKDTELKDNLLTFNCENLSKALKVLDNPVSYGNLQKLKLERDKTIQSKTLNFHVAPVFTDPGIWSIHPTIAEVGSPLFTHTGTINVYGVNKTKSADTFIIVKSINDPFYYLPSTTQPDANETTRYYFNIPLKVSYLSGGNSGNIYRVKYLTQYYLGGFWYNKIYLNGDFDSTDFKAFDRISISENAVYFQISNTLSPISDVYAKIDDVFYELSSTSYSRKTINDLEYLVLYPTDKVYREIPIDTVISSYVYEPGNGTESGTTITANSGAVIDILDNDFSNPFSYYHDAPDNITSVISRYTIKADLTKANDKAIHLGLNINFNHMTHGAGDYGFQTHYQVTLKDGNKLEPNNAWGLAIETIASGPQVVCKVQTAPYGDIVGPNTINDANYPPGNLAFDKAQFDKYKLDIASEIYGDVDSITLQTRMYAGDGSGNPSRNHAFYKLGLYVEESVESLDEVYIDTSGTLGFEPPYPVLSANDHIAYEILYRMNQNPDPSFKFSDTSVVNYNHLAAPSKSKSSDLLDVLSREGLFVTGSIDKNIYSKPLITTTDDAKVDLSINSSYIIGIKEPLKDVDLESFYNLVKLEFKDSAGESESVEIISLTNVFPSLAAIQSSENAYSSVFEFSSNFLAKFKKNATLEASYNWLKSFWDICKSSYVKNAIENQGTIAFETIYLEDVLKPATVNDNNAQNRILNLVRMNSQRRKKLVVDIPWYMGVYFPIKLGSRIKFFHPDIMQNNTLYGFVERVAINLFDAVTTVSLIVDSFKDGNGNPEFF